MHRALCLPEIVSAILCSEASSPGFLHNCLFINRLFSFEACRILWHWCGSTIEAAPSGNPRPEVCRLAHIIKADVRRAQIHKLSFRTEGEEYEKEARWHNELRLVQFPQLEAVFFHEADYPSTPDSEAIVLHYAQPNLKELALYEGSDLSDHFLETLRQRSPSLHQLVLKATGSNTITSDALTRFLECTTSIASLDISYSFDGAWSSQAFQAVSKYPHLELLVLPQIEDSWIEAVSANVPISGAFPALNYLQTRISDNGAEHLSHVMPNLRYLVLSPSIRPAVMADSEPRLVRSHHLLSAVARFSQLREFVATFDSESIVSGHELLLLAQNCPRLQVLSVSTPSTVGITDSLVETLAPAMGNISELTLTSHNAVSLTSSSLQLLGRYCKKLECVELSCSSDWQENWVEESSTLFPNLWKLKLAPHGVYEDRMAGPVAADNENLQKLADRIAALGPKLGRFEIEDPNEVEEVLVDLVQDICDDRVY
jgi:hypothetical protein